MEQKIVFLKVVEIKTKEDKKYFKIKFLTEDLEYHEQFIDSGLMQKIANEKYQALKLYKGIFKMYKDMRLLLVDICL